MYEGDEYEGYKLILIKWMGSTEACRICAVRVISMLTGCRHTDPSVVKSLSLLWWCSLASCHRASTICRSCSFFLSLVVIIELRSR